MSEVVSDKEQFFRGLALYDDGEPFEAHEEWEHCWKAAKARGDAVDEKFLRALIHLCAARIKHAQQNAIGLKSHLESAARLLREIEVPMHRGMDLVTLRNATDAALAGNVEQHIGHLDRS